jgi:hypothetical protein
MMLLETMIAFALIVLCVLPLLTPHIAMLKAERQFVRKIDLDHVVNLLYASVLEKLYLNEIGWNELMQNDFPITKEDLEKLGYSSLLAYQGSYNFKEVPPRFKPRDVNADYSLHLLTLTFNFIPSELSQKEEEVKQKNLLKYQYKVFIVHDKRPTNATQ